MLPRYLKVERVEAGVRPAANWPFTLNLHGIQQVLITETGGPADLELGLLNTAGTRVVELQTEREQEGGQGGVKRKPGSCQYCALFCLISRSPAGRGCNEVIITEG